MKFRMVALVAGLVLVVAMVVGSAGTVSAQTAPWIRLTGAPSGICTYGGGVLSFPFTAKVNSSGSNVATLDVPGVGQAGYYAEDMGWPLDGPGSYGLPTSAYSVAANTHLTVKIVTYVGYGQTGGVSSESWLVFDCTTGAVIESWFSGGSYQAAPVPEGFMQHEILCDSPVFDSPGGSYVGDNMVRAGQAWHVNPTPVSGPAGELWTEIHVAGLSTGYIRTLCVGGPTPFN